MQDWIYILIIVFVSVIAGDCVALYSWHLLRNIEDSDFDKNYSISSFPNILTGLVVAALNTGIYMVYGFGSVSLIYMFMVFVLTAVSLVDWNSYEIPVQFNYVLFILGIIRLILDYTHWYTYIIGMFLVSGIFFALALATKGKGMGGGDIKLMFTCGLILGWQKIFLVMIIGSLLGAVVHSILMRILKKEHMLAFGPYLAAGIYVAVTFGDKIISWYLSQFPSVIY